MEIVHSVDEPVSVVLQNCGINRVRYSKVINVNSPYELPLLWVIKLTNYTKNYKMMFWIVDQLDGVFIPPGMRKSLKNIRGLTEDLWKMIEEKK